jgi:hypothetical protein
MKLIIPSSPLAVLCGLALSLSGSLQATEPKVIPTEISQPPYAVGDLVVQQGHYIHRGAEQTSVNFRLEDNSVRIYWIDTDGLIAEAEASSGSVHLKGSNVRGNPYQSFEPLSDNTGLAAPRRIFPPHDFFVRLVLKKDAESEPEAYGFHYNTNMDKEIDPTIGSN